MAKVLSINKSSAKGTVKIPCGSGRLIIEQGLAHDAHNEDGIRQLSLLAVESIDKVKQDGITLPYGSFAENITTVGIVLHTLAVGQQIKIGETLVEVTQIGKKCHNRCEIGQRIGKCIMPSEGIFARVIDGGLITVGDEINLV